MSHSFRVETLTHLARIRPSRADGEQQCASFPSRHAEPHATRRIRSRRVRKSFQNTVEQSPATPNHALQPTGAHVTPRAHSATAIPPSAHGPRHARPWLSLGSLGDASRLVK